MYGCCLYFRKTSGHIVTKKTFIVAFTILPTLAWYILKFTMKNDFILNKMTKKKQRCVEILH